MATAACVSGSCPLYPVPMGFAERAVADSIVLLSSMALAKLLKTANANTTVRLLEHIVLC